MIKSISILPKILISIFVIIIGTVLVVSITKCQKNKASSKTEGEMQIVISDIDGNVLDDRKVKFDVEWSMMDVLTNTYGYDLRTGKGTYGLILYGILDKDKDGNLDIDTDFVNTYIAIYVDGKYSTKGISTIEVRDGMKLELKETKVK